jgi:membrane-associated protease RseP (regulator of RpoE activity)
VLSDTSEQNAVVDNAGSDNAAVDNVVADGQTSPQTTQEAVAPQTVAGPPSRGRLGKGWRWGISAAVLVVVAGVFFTIGWFASSAGDRERLATWGMGERMNLRQQGPDEWQSCPGRAWGMGVPQQGQGRQQYQYPQQTPSTPQTPSIAAQGYLGVGLETVTPQVQQQYGLSRSSGALVVTLDGRGPAVQAGIQRGDIITAIDGATVSSREDVVNAITQKKAGDSVSVAGAYGTWARRWRSTGMKETDRKAEAWRKKLNSSVADIPANR